MKQTFSSLLMGICVHPVVILDIEEVIDAMNDLH